jgi:hypothetical protein
MLENNNSEIEELINRLVKICEYSNNLLGDVGSFVYSLRNNENYSLFVRELDRISQEKEKYRKLDFLKDVRKELLEKREYINSFYKIQKDLKSDIEKPKELEALNRKLENDKTGNLINAIELFEVNKYLKKVSEELKNKRFNFKKAPSSNNINKLSSYRSDLSFDWDILNSVKNKKKLVNNSFISTEIIKASLTRVGRYLIKYIKNNSSDFDVEKVKLNRRLDSDVRKLDELLINKNINSREGMIDKDNKYIDVQIIKSLEALNRNSSYDLTKLIYLCKELNLACVNKCYYAAIMLIRAIIDHIPPVFGKQSFGEVANNYGGEKSFQDNMKSLDKFSRNIADLYIHKQIKKKTQSSPSFNQIDFRAPIDLLLQEVINILSEK